MKRLIGMIAAAASMSFCASPTAAYRGGALEPMEPIFLPGSFGRATTKRGKHKPRRHGQKLKSCRVKIGRRVRRKHRRAA